MPSDQNPSSLETDQSPSTHSSSGDARVPSRVFIDEGFVWDEFDAYLFDIDGTLLRSRDGIHYGAFSHAVKTVLGHPLGIDGVVLHGNTDPGILRQAFRLAALEDKVWLESADAIASEMSRHVLSRRAELDVWVMPGVEATLGHLQRKGATLGVATGNLEAIGWLKVEVARLRHWFAFGGFADGYDLRADMIAHALEVAHRTAWGAARSGDGGSATVCVVGDTPSDIAAARANGLPTIAVATGHYSFDELMENRPEACASTLTALLDYRRTEREVAPEAGEVR